MKKTLLITLLLIPFLGISQTTKPIDGFLGIKFGCSRAQAIAALNAKGGIINVQHSSKDKIQYSKITLGHREAYQVQLSFINDKLYLGVFFFKEELEPKTIDYYNDLVSDVSSIYGTGVATKSFKEPYADGDGFEVQAISHGNATYEMTWVSPNKNFIFMTILSNLYIQLSYQDDALSTEATSNQKAKEKSDF